MNASRTAFFGSQGRITAAVVARAAGLDADLLAVADQAAVPILAKLLPRRSSRTARTIGGQADPSMGGLLGWVKGPTQAPQL